MDAAVIHSNPRLKEIHLHTLRHCKALREYHKTRDILHVMCVLGHKNINTTYRYLSLYTQIYSYIKTQKYLTKIASPKQERCDLITDGWELVNKEGMIGILESRNDMFKYESNIEKREQIIY